MAQAKRLTFSQGEQQAIRRFLQSRRIVMERGLRATREMLATDSTEHTRQQYRHYKSAVGTIDYLLSTVAQSWREREPAQTG